MTAPAYFAPASPGLAPAWPQPENKYL